MTWIYLSADEVEMHPYSLICGRKPQRIVWDRFNTALPMHLYMSENLFYKRSRSRSTRYFALLNESEAIIPGIYQRVRDNLDYMKNEFEMVFTHTTDLLESLPNARLVPPGGVWYGTPLWGGVMSEQGPEKSKLVSIVASNKGMCPLHFFRRNTAKHLMDNPIVDAMGRAVGDYVPLNQPFDDYRYSVVIENLVTDYYFTEKILNCFASHTVPIYLGATRIGEFFNPDGIITIKEPTLEAIDEALKQCSEADYEARREAILDNYHRVQHFLCTEDYICERYPDFLDPTAHGK